MGQHARLSASGADRWINCPPSVKLGERFPDTASSYAAEGTVAHKVAEIILRRDLGLLPAEEAVLQLEEASMAMYYTKDMPANLEPYTEYVTAHAVGAEFVGLEERLDFSDWVPEGFGTGDTIIIKDRMLEVVDLKYGKGLEVDARGNPQLRLYGLGAVQEWEMLYPFDTVRMTIIQPRLDSITSADMSVVDLVEWGDTVVRPAAGLAQDGKGEYRSGAHCRWCKARAVCRRRAEDNLELAKHEFAEPALLTDTDIADILEQADLLVNWASDIKAYALDQALNHGKTYEGYKVVEGRSNRQLVNTDTAVQILLDNGVAEDALYQRSLVGIPAMEKVVGKRRLAELLEDHIVKPPGKPALVKLDDKRPALHSHEAAAEDFKNG